MAIRVGRSEAAEEEEKDEPIESAPPIERSELESARPRPLAPRHRDSSIRRIHLIRSIHRGSFYPPVDALAIGLAPKTPH